MQRERKKNLSERVPGQEVDNSCEMKARTKEELVRTCPRTQNNLKRQLLSQERNGQISSNRKRMNLSKRVRGRELDNFWKLKQTRTKNEKR